MECELAVRGRQYRNISSNVNDMADMRSAHKTADTLGAREKARDTYTRASVDLI